MFSWWKTSRQVLHGLFFPTRVLEEDQASVPVRFDTTPPPPKEKLVLSLRGPEALKAKDLYDAYAKAANLPGAPCHGPRYRLWDFLISKNGLRVPEDMSGVLEIRHSMLTFEVWLVEKEGTHGS